MVAFRRNCDNKMTTEVCRVHILWIFQITKITPAKSPIQKFDMIPLK